MECVYIKSLLKNENKLPLESDNKIYPFINKLKTDISFIFT